ncbi:Radical SAM superfamily enzyme YgiQ, UPF0313 family [Tistlia consotensis]|uniref:Radical SAM superfamily enzyme YgiQ, UPF0313 family n=1 Tax=Tistlia consotensis USBA 355 TaxID=560819 RepID=A0A1Y6CK26_9PROT|nr:cobalamin-dependent protein [Tistlia consotensis]SMF71480.1 Radical SAM superfamily enzyme YgiQ, UPF0313 family [Tistlia consotensis USBA 355]SNS06603.1 Radical SAM superfamily enzyme YgiQ, UPF0313 family [Tistlia consotensis]
MKICLIRPGLVTTAGAIGIEIILPLGIAYLAAHLRQEGFEVSFVDAVGEDIDAFSPLPDLPDGVQRGIPDEETVARIPADVDVIGVSCMFSVGWVISRRLIQAVRRRFPDAVLIIGGEHATAMPEYCLRDTPELDFVVLGEGEHTTAELLHTLERGGDPETVTGVAFLRDGEYRVAPPRARERELVSLPWPAWDMLPVENYLNNVTAGLEYGRTMPIIASRGCPYECTFCSNPVMWGKLWRARPAEDVVAEIEHNARTYNITNVDFFDLTTIVKRSWIIEFCNMMIERRLGVTWQLITTRSEMIDEEVTRLMKQAGCTYVTYAAESGSTQVLTDIKKKVDREAMLRSIGFSVDSGLGVKMNFVCGFPDDSLSDILASYKMAARAAWRGAHDVGFFPFTPYPGSALFQRLLDEGKITINDQFFFGLASYNFSQIRSVARNFSDRQLQFLCLTGIALFYLVSFGRRPVRAWDLLLEILRSEGKTKLSAALVRMIKKRRGLKQAATAGA